MKINLQAALAKAVTDAQAPGAVGLVGNLDETLFFSAVGARQRFPVRRTAKKSTLYDLASLTKVIVTATGIMMLREEGRLDLEQPVSEFIPLPVFDRFTLRHLLTHTSGLSSIEPFHLDTQGLDAYITRIGALDLISEPGTRRRYSDLGYILLGKVIELVARDSLDAFAASSIFGPLGMTDTVFRPTEELRRRCAATEQDPWRGRMIVGEVHDENAYAIGGVSGHAGLFSTASDLAKYCRALLGSKLLTENTLDDMCLPGQVPHYRWQGLGWKLNPWMSGAEGFLSTRRAFGHTGWTGTSIWMDRDTGLFSLLLSNTCHPRREQRDSKTLRTVFHTHVAAKFYPETSNAHTGLDRVVWDYFAVISKKRIALLTHHAAVDESGRAIVEVLRLDPQVRVERLYSPEHGLQGKGEAGASIASEDGDVSVTSLYGDRKEPSVDELANIDLFVVDLQDIGSRYYTYMATMKDCMAACAAAKVPMLILDRPNPIGGTVLEGPIAQQTGAPVCSAPIPIRHGMTLGELALFFRDTEFKDTALDLTISEADNWPRERHFDACALPWQPPSPNIPTPETALLYVGMCLFEGVNLNEGRGTDIPFQNIGAPWIDAEKICAQLDPKETMGCTVEPTTYTPRSIPGKASSPRCMDEVCYGVTMRITDPDAARPFTLALALLRAILTTHPDQLTFLPFFDTLAGGPWLREQLQAHKPTHKIIVGIAPQLEAFDAIRPKRYKTMPELLKQGRRKDR